MLFFVIAIVSCTIFIVLVSEAFTKFYAWLERIETNTEKPNIAVVIDGDIDYTDGQQIYVPAYAQIPFNNRRVQKLNILLSVRNTDPKGKINIKRVDYYDTKGRLVEQFIERPFELAPLETKEFLIRESDHKGGSGANFFLEWSAPENVYEPYVEALMYGNDGAQTFTFKSTGQVFKSSKVN